MESKIVCIVPAGERSDKKQMKRFEGNVALVTGGNRGIGFAVVRMLVAQGASVALSARNQTQGEKAAAAAAAKFIPTDVRSASDCEKAVNDTLHAFGRLDILVNAAGIILFSTRRGYGCIPYRSHYHQRSR